MPPTEPSANWWPILVVAFVIAGVLAGGWYRYVMSRIEKDRTKLHDHAGTLQLHEHRIGTLEDDVQDLKGEKRHDH